MGLIYMHKLKSELLVNSSTNGVYIGQTKHNDPHIRWRDGLGYITKNVNNKFYNAINKYGFDNFEHIILEYGVPDDNLDEREMYYINKYESYTKGYNSTIGGNTPKGTIHTDEFREACRIRMTGKRMPLSGRVKQSEKQQRKVRVVDIFGNETIYNSRTECAKALDVNNTTQPFANHLINGGIVLKQSRKCSMSKYEGYIIEYIENSAKYSNDYVGDCDE